MPPYAVVNTICVFWRYCTLTHMPRACIHPVTMYKNPTRPSFLKSSLSFKHSYALSLHYYIVYLMYYILFDLTSVEFRLSFEKSVDYLHVFATCFSVDPAWPSSDILCGYLNDYTNKQIHVIDCWPLSSVWWDMELLEVWSSFELFASLDSGSRGTCHSRRSSINKH